MEGGLHFHSCANCGEKVEHENPDCIDEEYECDRCWEEFLGAT
jgi:DNA-directed RNA polymerase subunit RPC12/RpoP